MPKHYSMRPFFVTTDAEAMGRETYEVAPPPNHPETGG
jgi:hypothetical protein